LLAHLEQRLVELDRLHRETVLRTFENLVDVVDASLFEALDSREPRHDPVART
jgi:hypothetical protein